MVSLPRADEGEPGREGAYQGAGDQENGTLCAHCSSIGDVPSARGRIEEEGEEEDAASIYK
ncbi:hypothetical protein GCM10010345_08180 [Streptomyces canarius]|uniref:Uncharacterized protein n=1 Tax=Streptomyces canarius TaxID=285453 RepID=A0ABQ3CHY8_9ACTN|nr:hypothetical protein GCM10010345_08180 [Streptomyces canarius]